MHQIWTCYSFLSLSCSMILRVITNSSYSNKTALICITTWGVNIIRWHSSPLGQEGCTRVTTGLLITPPDLYLWGFQGLKFTLPFRHSAQKTLKWYNDSWPEHSMMRVGLNSLLVGNALCYQRSPQWAAATTRKRTWILGDCSVLKKSSMCVFSIEITHSPNCPLICSHPISIYKDTHVYVQVYF